MANYSQEYKGQSQCFQTKIEERAVCSQGMFITKLSYQISICNKMYINNKNYDNIFYST